jgi:carbon monoxide dehydrogenase subunit G
MPLPPILRGVRAELTIEIARMPEEVFAYLTDVSNLTEWQSGVHEAEIVGGGEPRAGARISELRHLLGRELRTTLEIAEYEPPRLFVLRALDSPVPFTVHHELEPAGTGTRLTVVGEGDAGLLPGFAAGLMARRAEKQFRRDFEQLRALLEA